MGDFTELSHTDQDYAQKVFKDSQIVFKNFQKTLNDKLSNFIGPQTLKNTKEIEKLQTSLNALIESIEEGLDGMEEVIEERDDYEG